MKIADGLARPLAHSCSRGELEAENQYRLRWLVPVFLNSKEEIGWKVQPQNSNLGQEVT